ncbi:histidine phosphatase family protein [Marinospirillum minutulum]|uniref:histidine phosphatase family protein n=1 Tax=Marinospirillum minutulum TaxID=64974 RepID=UPI00040DCCCE|nr:histidine phosphatase family protein [Marinospirillum minutulum]
MSVIIWRHPKPLNAAGICLGHTDLAVDPRRTRNLAYKVQQEAKRLELAPVLHVSPLQRSRGVGEFLAKQGWQVKIDPLLIEFNFGTWDGLPWEQIDRHEMDSWCNNFADYAPGGGENLKQLFNRVESWLSRTTTETRLVVGHAGWINAARMLAAKKPLPSAPEHWSSSVNYGKKSILNLA